MLWIGVDQVAACRGCLLSCVRYLIGFVLEVDAGDHVADEVVAVGAREVVPKKPGTRQVETGERIASGWAVTSKSDSGCARHKTLDFRAFFATMLDLNSDVYHLTDERPGFRGILIMVRLRFRRMGRRHRPFYRLNAIDRKAARDGRDIEQLGWYDPTAKDDDQQFHFDEPRVRHWLSNGAQPSRTVASLLKKAGIR